MVCCYIFRIRWKYSLCFFSLQAISQFPQCTNDISFWLPDGATSSAVSSDFYDLVRTVGGDLVEQVTLFDEFQHPKTKRRSHAYRVVYRHMEKTLTQEEVNEIHEEVAKMAIQEMGVEIRWWGTLAGCLGIIWTPKPFKNHTWGNL